jgi:nucleoside-diphosphate-sugar epimerase
LEPTTSYGVTKAAATLYCRSKAVQDNLPISTLRLYSVYGPLEAPERFIPAIAVYGMAGRLPPLVNPDVARDFVYVDDVVDGFVLAATNAAGHSESCYNVGTGVQRTVRDVVAISRRLFRLTETAHWESMPNRAWDTAIWVADSSRIATAFRWSARYDLERGLETFVEWLQANPALLDYYRHSGRL